MTGMAVSPDPTEGTPNPAVPDVPSVADAVRIALDGTGHGWLRRVAVAADGGTVVLRGVVPSFYLKQLAQMTVMALPGVATVRNELQVRGGGR